MIDLKWITKSDTIYYCQVFNDDQLVYSFICHKGKIFNDDGESYVDFTKVKFTDHIKNKEINFEHDDGKDISPSDLVDALGHYSDSLGSSEMEVFGKIFSDYISIDVSCSSFDCECCGQVDNYEINITNKEKNAEVSFYEDGHLGNGYLPTAQDLFTFIFTGKCNTECQDYY